MKIIVNGKEKTYDDETLTVEKILEVNNVEKPDMVNVQVNGEIVKKDNYSKVKVKDSDEVDFIYFMGGGRF